MALSLINAPARAARGEVFEIRASIAHGMESGQRADSQGRLLVRNIIRRVECRYGGELVFAADLFPAIAANPYLAFHTVALASGPISVRWVGDNGFEHSASISISIDVT
jgi:sulfur-oxidizing protein SoxZ